MPLVGYMLGARVFEKHFTLNRTWKGTDQAFSLEPAGMRRVVRDLHRARIALGDGVKRAYESEIKPLTKMAKKLVAARDLPPGACSLKRTSPSSRRRTQGSRPTGSANSSAASSPSRSPRTRTSRSKPSSATLRSLEVHAARRLL